MDFLTVVCHDYSDNSTKSIRINKVAIIAIIDNGTNSTIVTDSGNRFDTVDNSFNSQF